MDPLRLLAFQEALLVRKLDVEANAAQNMLPASVAAKNVDWWLFEFATLWGEKKFVLLQ